jgi:hypothetical protein
MVRIKTTKHGTIALTSKDNVIRITRNPVVSIRPIYA